MDPAFNNFIGLAKPLEAVDIAKLAFRIRVSEDHMRAVIEVEAAGRSFDKQNRPAMLFEPHVFFRQLQDQPVKQATAVEQGLAYRSWKPGNYPADSYPRLKQAMLIDETAALKSASWGAAQILGENHVMIGFQTVQQMVKAFMDSAEAHIEGMVRFILAHDLADDIRAGRWATFARIYNGPGYARNGYHTKLAQAYTKWSRIADVAWAPDAPDPENPSPVDAEQLRNVQRKLAELGYPEVGRADGAWGTRTRAAVLAFRADNGLPTVAQIDDDFLKALAVGRNRAVSPTRAEATVEDLRAAGSETIAVTDAAKRVGAVVAAGGVFGAVVEILNGVLAESDALEGLKHIIQPIAESVGIDASLVLLAVGAYSFWANGRLQEIRLRDHQSGKHLGR
jgi:hypothetical protein